MAETSKHAHRLLEAFGCRAKSILRRRSWTEEDRTDVEQLDEHEVDQIRAWARIEREVVGSVLDFVSIVVRSPLLAGEDELRSALVRVATFPPDSQWAALNDDSDEGFEQRIYKDGKDIALLIRLLRVSRLDPSRLYKTRTFASTHHGVGTIPDSYETAELHDLFERVIEDFRKEIARGRFGE
ncbi:MAG: hypothetical protein IPM29_00145 [Planctomycetes bacterium]|nr:hypothetical protein [Planctomycetota bacterium]